MLHPGSSRPPAVPRRTRLTAIGIGIGLAIAIVAMALNVGMAPVVIIGGSAVLAYGAWLATTYRRPVDPAIVPLYLVAVALQVIHTGEEYLMRFPDRFSDLFGLQLFSLDAFALAVMALFAATWILAGVGLLYRNPLANYLLWFFVLGPGLVNAVAHVSFPLITRSGYFPGLVTVILPTIPSLLILWRLLFPRRRFPRPAAIARA